MTAMWKFPIPVQASFEVAMPAGPVKYVAVQGGGPFMWVRVDPTSDARVTRRFHVRCTGHPIEGDLRYLGSFMLHDGAFVGHLFES